MILSDTAPNSVESIQGRFMTLEIYFTIGSTAVSLTMTSTDIELLYDIDINRW